ncbi:MAG: alpha/beta fold hydrolase [Enterobacteriaceae bacterium]|nr:alpha/beta fold hydrolase [Enterobacteriaceae bacterium]
MPLRPAGNLPPLFLIHEVMGDLLVYSRLLTLLPTDLPIYGLQALGLHTVENPPASIEELAAYHIEAIRRVQPHGPYHLAGWSIGGTIAYEIALQLADDGEEVGYVGMIDSYNLPECETGNQRPVDEQLENISRLIQYLEENNPDLADTDELYQLRNYDVFRWLPADLKKEDMLLYIRTLELIIQLNQRYAPSASSLPVHLYTADDLTAGFDNWHGWRDIVGEHSVLQPIGGDHYTILQFPCINQLADAITGHLLSDAYSPDVIIQQGVDSVPPLFCIPGAGASASAFIELALALPPQLPVHALQSRGLTNTHLPPHISVEGTARDYIKALRQVQPYGPYHLLGHSFGGWLAFEIALQLQAQGEIVAALTLVDSDAPDLQRDNSQNGFPKVVGRIETLMELIGIYDLMLPQPLTLTRQDFAPLTADEQLRLLLQALINAGVFPANTEVSLLQGIVQVMQANLNTNYAPHIHFDGPVYLVSAKEDDRDDIATHENGWRNHVTQLNTVSISGNHMTMLSNPHVRQLATLLCTEILEPK